MYPRNYQFFPLSACREVLNILSKWSCNFCGLVKEGVYVHAPHSHSKKQSVGDAAKMVLHSVPEVVIFSHIHREYGPTSEPYIK